MIDGDWLGTEVGAWLEIKLGGDVERYEISLG